MASGPPQGIECGLLVAVAECGGVANFLLIDVASGVVFPQRFNSADEISDWNSANPVSLPLANDVLLVDLNARF